MVQACGGTLLSVSAPNGYTERFSAALDAAGLDPGGMARRLGISYQAVKKVVDGKSNMLATGEGQRTRDRVQLTVAERRLLDSYRSLPPDRRLQVETLAENLQPWAPTDPPPAEPTLPPTKARARTPQTPGA